jgi:hypothetical protein
VWLKPKSPEKPIPVNNLDALQDEAFELGFDKDQVIVADYPVVAEAYVPNMENLARYGAGST